VSCPAEWKLAVYVDDELPAEDVRPLELHLVECQDCRTLVVGLREEAELLADVLHERPVNLPAAVPRPAPARGFAVGLLPAVAGFIAATTFFTWIFESGGASLEWFSPLRLRGAIQMGFDFIFMLRDRAPGVFELVLAMAALASVSAMLTYAVTALSRRWLGTTSLGIACLLLAAAPDTSSAHFGMHEHANLRVAAGEVHEGAIVAIQGENVDIDGEVTGDVFVLAHRVTIRGKVRGNVFAGAQDVEVSGEVDGSLHVIGSRTIVSGRVEENVYSMSENFSLASQGAVGRDLWVRSYGAAVEGNVGRDVYAAGRWIELRGAIERDLWVRDLRVSVMPTAKIGGDIHARLEEGEAVELSPGSTLGGEVFTEVLRSEHGSSLSRFSDGGFYLWFALRVAGAFLVGMLLHLIVPRIFAGQLETSGDFFRCMGIGVVALLAVPAALALAFVTLAGIPVAVFGWWSYLAALYCGGILIAALIGTSILRPRSDETSAFGLPLLLGIFLVCLGMSLPLVGVPVRAVVVLTGLGLLLERVRGLWKGELPAAA
jgi:cytoskeletal protein CcmA (bactofilin family)